MYKSGRNALYNFLRWTETYTKTDMLYLTKGSFWLLSGQGIGMVVSLVLAIAFANLIDPESYGNYKYVLSLAGIIGAFSLSELGTAVLRAIARGHEGTLRYAFRLSLFWSIGMIFISGIVGIYYLFNDNYFLGYSLLIIGATIPLISAGSLYRPFLVGKRAFKKLALYSIVQSIFPTLSVLGALLLKAPLLLLVATYFITNAIIIRLLYAKTKKLAQNTSIDPSTNKLGKHLSVMGVISAVAGKLDSILIFQLLGGAELAIFSLAITLPDIIRSSFKHITSLAVPKFSEKTKEEMKQAVWSKTKIVFIATGCIALVYIFLAPFIFDVLFPLYKASVPYSQVYALSLFTSLLLASAYFDSQIAIKERYILNIVINGTTIVSTIIGIYFFGIWGAIFARLIARAVNILLSSFLIYRH
ncbi:MAG TPA: oligosaccharide flippase family protein [Candidatus Paceibacterota bacterium]